MNEFNKLAQNLSTITNLQGYSELSNVMNNLTPALKQIQPLMTSTEYLKTLDIMQSVVTRLSTVINTDTIKSTVSSVYSPAMDKLIMPFTEIPDFSSVIDNLCSPFSSELIKKQFASSYTDKTRDKMDAPTQIHLEEELSEISSLIEQIRVEEDTVLIPNTLLNNTSSTTKEDSTSKSAKMSMNQYSISDAINQLISLIHIICMIVFFCIEQSNNNYQEMVEVSEKLTTCIEMLTEYQTNSSNPLEEPHQDTTSISQNTLPLSQDSVVSLPPDVPESDSVQCDNSYAVSSNTPE